MVQSYALNTHSKIQEEMNYEGRYHREEAIHIGDTGPLDDYCEIYRFPCCGKTVKVGDGKPSRFRADGCCVDTKKW